MMRLIDADALPIRSIAVRGSGKSCYDVAKAWLMAIVKSAPTVDAVPVVRCKDCKRLVILSKYGIPVCDEGTGFKPLCYDINTWFCPLGERRCDNDTP